MDNKKVGMSAAGQNLEVRTFNREVGFASKNGHGLPSLSGPKSAKERTRFTGGRCARRRWRRSSDGVR